MTQTEFLKWEDAQPTRNEFFAGKIIPRADSRRIHVEVMGNILVLLKTKLRGTPYQIFAVGMRLQATENIFYPDIFVTCNPQDLKADLVMRHPRVIIEILSPTTAAFDRGDKFAAYRQIESLQEYVLVDPDTQHIDVYRRTPENDWLLAASEAAYGLRLKSLDFHATPAEVFEDLEA